MQRLAFVFLGACLASSCADSGGSPPSSSDGGTECMVDEDCGDDGVFCNGTLACMDGQCIAANVPECNDGVGCTRDECLAATDECQNTPENAACPMGTVCVVGEGCQVPPACEFDGDCGGDGVYCNGDEVCVAAECVAPGSRDCDDGDSCTIDECVESMAACASTLADNLNDPRACGITGMNDCIACPMPPATGHAVASCSRGLCGFECEMGWFDRDGDPANFCEVMCTLVAGVDVPDDSFVDGDCDGIDGDSTRAVFLSTAGADSNDGLTAATAVRSFDRAFQVASAVRRDQILVAEGTYGTTAALMLPNGVGVYGGYSDDFLTRRNVHASLVAASATALIARNLTAQSTVDRIDISTEPRMGPSEHSVVIIVDGSGDFFTLRHSIIAAGRGGDGTAGMAGGVGGVGGRGGNASGATGGGPGSGGGGRGATGRRRATGPAGQPGARNSSTCGGTAGSGSGSAGLGCADGDPRDGGDGGAGCTGAAGSAGVGGDGIGSLVGTVWMPTNTGATGVVGGRGGGGGGGGAGGGENCTAPIVGCVFCGTGRGGGGGGGGGIGGSPGTGGGGGGASIGIVIDRSTVDLETVVIRTGGGGGGSSGGGGGPGGNGGQGGMGVVSSDTTEGSGGDGGLGGDGGIGGCGGGGGGGPSIGAWGSINGQLRPTGSVIYMVGPGGPGGGSCPTGMGGSSGMAADRRSVTIL